MIISLVVKHTKHEKTAAPVTTRIIVQSGVVTLLSKNAAKSELSNCLKCKYKLRCFVSRYLFVSHVGHEIYPPGSRHAITHCYRKY